MYTGEVETLEIVVGGRRVNRIEFMPGDGDQFRPDRWVVTSSWAPGFSRETLEEEGETLAEALEYLGHSAVREAEEFNLRAGGQGPKGSR